MWIVAKIKKKEIKTFKEDSIKEAGKDIQFYCPKIEYHQYFRDKVKRLEKLALENYIFCYHKNFKDSLFINKLKFIKGLEYYLNGHYQDQNEIKMYVEKAIKNSNLSKKQIKSFYSKPENRHKIQDDLINLKLYKYLKEYAIINEVVKSTDEVKKERKISI